MPLVTNPVEAPPITARPSVATDVYRSAREIRDWITSPDRWLTGIEFAPLGCDIPVGVATNDPCDLTTTDPALIDLQPEGADAATGCIVFMPFRAEWNIQYQNLVGLPQEELSRRLEQKRQLFRSYIVAKEVYDGALTAANPSLVGNATDVSANIIDGTAVGALAAVEDGLGQRIGNGEGFIHLSPGTFTFLASGGGIFNDGTGWTTPAGNRVVVDAGYLGGAPSTGTVTATRPWIYGSGPVFFDSRGLSDNGEPWQRYNYVENLGNLWSEEYFVVAFEPCSVVAAQIPA